MSSQFGQLPVYQGAVSSDGIVVYKTPITQITSIATGVTANGSAGVITTFSASAVAGAADTFTLTNSSIKADSVVKAQVIDYAGTFSTHGLPVVAVNSISAGSCDVVVMNGHSANALSGVLKIAFIVQ